MDRYVLQTEKNSYSVSSDSQDFKQIPYLLMILNNLTTIEKGATQFLSEGKKDIEGVLFLKMLDPFLQYIYNKEMDFFSAVIANVSASKTGRVMLLEYKVFEIILAKFDKMNNIKMINMLRVFRNCAFEFETHEENLLARGGFMFSLLFKILIEANIENNKDKATIGCSTVDDIYFTHFDKSQAIEERETINDLVVDIFLVFTNSEKALDMIKNKGLKNIFYKIRPIVEGNKNLCDRIFVIMNYFES